MPSKLEYYKAKLDAIMEEHYAALTELGAELRTDIVLPICKRRKLRYGAVHGYTLFVPLDKKRPGITDVEEAKEYKERSLLRVFPILNLECGSNDVLGYFVEDVTKEDFNA